MALSEEEELSSAWVSQLETALTEGVDADLVQEVTRGQTLPENLRAKRWEACLGIREPKNVLATFDEMFDLAEQEDLRNDCQQLVDKLGNEEEDKVSVISDLESVLTCYCKTLSLNYESGNGWLELLAPLLALKLPRVKLYNSFHAITSKYVSRNLSQSALSFHLFRLLILYHDPELCSFLDSKKITPEVYCKPWFRSLFSSVCDLKVTQHLWDVYFRQDDPFLVFFLSLVILINAKDNVMSLPIDEKESIISTLSQAPAALEDDDVEDFCSLALFYASRTPQSFRKCYGSLFDPSATSSGDQILDQSLCLPVSMDEVLQIGVDKETYVRFFVIDCRPAEQYNCGHLATAFHLDASLMLQDPQAFATATDALLTVQQQALAAGSVAAGEHLCFLGSGREDEDQYVNMVVASFLQKHTQHVSWARGGYIALHEIPEGNVCLADHSPRGCIACNPVVMSPDEADFSRDTIFSRLTGLKSRAAEVAEKFVDYIQNANPNQPVERHVSSTDKLGKRYRNMASVFTIDDDQDGETDVAAMNQDDDVVNLATWLKNPKIADSFSCHHITMNGYLHPSRLVVTDTHLYVVQNVTDKPECGRITSKRSLTSIVKITSKRKHPELITFKYGSPTGDTFTVTDMDRCLIPKAGDATKLVKQQIVSLLEKQIKDTIT